MEWSISREELQQGLREMVEGKGTVCVDACYGASAAALGGCSDGTRVLSRGLLWAVSLQLNSETMTASSAEPSGAAGLSIYCYAPQLLGAAAGVADTGVRLVVHRSGGGAREEGFRGVMDKRSTTIQFGIGRGWPRALRLAAGATSSGGGSGVGGGGGTGSTAQVEAEVAVQLARFSEWLHEGKITGSITFMTL